MASERGHGHLLRRKLGQDREKKSYGGSLHLVDASLTNLRLGSQSEVKAEILDREQKSALKENYRRKLSALQFLEKLQKDAMTSQYLDKDSKGKATGKSQTLQKSASQRSLSPDTQRTKLPRQRRISRSLGDLRDAFKTGETKSEKSDANTSATHLTNECKNVERLTSAENFMMSPKYSKAGRQGLRKKRTRTESGDIE